MEITTSMDIPLEIDHAICGLLDKEASMLLRQTGNKIVKREQMFLDHYRSGQSAWAPSSPAYVRWKKKKHGAAAEELGRLTGRLKRALHGDDDKALWTIADGKKRVLRIGLREKIGDLNIYALFQRGRFAGLTFKDQDGKERKFSPEEVKEARSKDFDTWRASNSRYEKFTTWKRRTGYQSTIYRRPGEQLQRNSPNARPLMFATQRDESTVASVMAEELAITMEKRGFE